MKTWVSKGLTAGKVLQAAAIVALIPASHLLADYLNYEPAALVQLALIAVGLACLVRVEWFASVRRKDVAAFGVASAVFAGSIVLGEHIVIAGSAYSGTATECYISAYSVMDVVALVAFTLLLTVLSLRILAFMRCGGGALHTQITPPFLIAIVR